MNTGSAIIIAAVMTAAIYAWRWLIAGEAPSAQLGARTLTGIGPLVSPEGFLVAWGVVFLTLSIIAAFSEALAGSLAISILIGDILANGIGISRSTSALREAKTQPAVAAVQAQPKKKGAPRRA